MIITVAPPVTDPRAEYQTPCLIEIGAAIDVVLGIVAAGEDHLGFSRRDFEFQSDAPSEEEVTRGSQRA